MQDEKRFKAKHDAVLLLTGDTGSNSLSAEAFCRGEVDSIGGVGHDRNMNALIKSPYLAKIGIVAAFGRFRRFGLHGPVYEIMEDEPRSSSRGPVVKVRVVESGEELDYRLESLIGDPQER